MGLGAIGPGEIVAGRYRVEAVIGRGGYGLVLRATQLNLGRPVALKVLLAACSLDPRTFERFMREALVAQRLEHPNTVRIYDLGQTEEGIPFIAFELLRGASLDEVLARDRCLGPERTARIAVQVLKSLAEAHAAGIVHRDIKPSNVFLCSFAHEPEFVKVLDFGIAKTLEPEPADRSSGGGAALTREGTTVGTPAYMAPEQVAGEALGPSADLYSLGLVMAECLSGVRVMDGPSPFAVCAAQAAPTPVPLPHAVLASPLAAVVARAVEKDPRRRFASANEMLHATLHALEAAATGAAQAWPSGVAHGPTAALPTPRSSGLVAYPSPPGGSLAQRGPGSSVDTGAPTTLPTTGVGPAQSHGVPTSGALGASGSSSGSGVAGASAGEGRTSRAGVALAAGLGGALALAAVGAGLVATGVVRLGGARRAREVATSSAGDTAGTAGTAGATAAVVVSGAVGTARPAKIAPGVPPLPGPPQTASPSAASPSASSTARGALALAPGAEVRGRTFCHLDDAALQKRFVDAGFRVAVVPTPQSSIFDVSGPGSAAGTIIHWRMDRMSRDFLAGTIEDGVFARDEVTLPTGTRTCLLHVDLGEGPVKVEQAYALLMLLTR